MAAYLTPAKVGELWDMSPRHVRRLCAGGELRAMKSGTDWRISPAAVAAYEAAHTSGASATPATHQQTQEVRPPTAVGGVSLPADYVPVFPHLWGMGGPDATQGEDRQRA